MGKKLLLFLACMLMTASMAFAQKQLTGKVIDSETGEPIIGAAVKVKGTTLGVLTDIDGKFTLGNLPSGSKTLVVSFMGMKTEEVPAKSDVTVALTSSISDLNEVMVVAYGTATKASFTGSAAVVKSEDIESVTTTNVLDAITGHVAGVEVYNATGDPTNSNPTLRIRGITSISAVASPLIVLDGTPYDGDMNTINTNDIESMTVLKDAAATSLYGARAANGVIVITTKKGKAGNAAKVTLDANWGSNSRAQRQYKTIKNPAQYLETYYTALNNYAQNTLGKDANAAHIFANQNMMTNNSYGLGTNIYNVPAGQYLIGSNGKLNPNATLGYTTTYNGQDYMVTPDDWVDETYRNALRQEYNVAVSNGNDKSNFYTSVGYLDNKGITNNSGYKALSGRLKADLQAKSWLKVGANMAFNHYDAQRVDEDGVSNSSGNPFAVATRVAPIYPMYIRDGQGNIMIDKNGFQMYDWADGGNAGYVRPYMTGSNAVQAAILDKNAFEGNAFYAMGFAEIRFLKDFKFTTTNSMNLDESRYTYVTNGFYGNYSSSNGIVSKSHSRGLSYTFQQLLNWSHVYGKHDVDAMIGHEWNKQTSYSLSASKNNMFDPNNDELNGAITDQSNAGSYRSMYNGEAFIGRAQYNYANKYFASASMRREASSNFAKADGRWWGNFYSGGAAWVMTEENFMKDIKWVDFLKAKVSYGEVGNNAIGSYRYINTYSISNSNGNPAATPNTMGNLDIKWEKNANLNAGFEFELFKSRLNGGIEYFWRKTSDMLYWFTTPSSFGWSGYYTNIGDMRNQGVEVELSAEVLRAKDFKWTVGVNLTHYQNKITSMPEERKTKDAYTFDGKKYSGYASSNNFMAEGLDRYTFYTQRYAGVYTEDTWNLTEDEAYDPSKAGQAMWWKQVQEDVKDADGNVVTDANGDAKQEFQGKNVATTTYGDASEYVLSKKMTPKLYGGFNTKVEYKGFDLSLDFSYQIGGNVIDSDYASFMSSPTSSSKGSNFHADILKSWSATNSGSNIPRLQFQDQYNGSTCDRFITDASYLNLQNITFGYNLPKDVVKKLQMEKVRLYINANNVYLWSKRQGLDPRVGMYAGGTANATYYSPIRTVSAGINVTF